MLINSEETTKTLLDKMSCQQVELKMEKKIVDVLCFPLGIKSLSYA